MLEHSVTLRSDLLCLMQVSTLGRSLVHIDCMGMNGCHALWAGGPLLPLLISPIHGSWISKMSYLPAVSLSIVWVLKFDRWVFI
jgi:hypothetical protein